MDQVKYNKTFYMLLFSTNTGREIRKEIWIFSWGEILINLLFFQNGRKQSRRSWFSFSFIHFNIFIDDLRKKHLVEFKSTKHRHRSLAVLILRPFFRLYLFSSLFFQLAQSPFSLFHEKLYRYYIFSIIISAFHRLDRNTFFLMTAFYVLLCYDFSDFLFSFLVSFNCHFTDVNLGKLKKYLFILFPLMILF